MSEADSGEFCGYFSAAIWVNHECMVMQFIYIYILIYTVIFLEGPSDDTPQVPRAMLDVENSQE